MIDLDCCFNCSTPCYAPFLGRITTFYPPPESNSQDANNTTQEGGDLIQPLSVSSALEIIFEGTLKYSKAHIPTNDNGPPEASIGLCANCAAILMDLYTYYCKFMTLTRSTSSFAALIKSSILWSFSSDERGDAYDKKENDPEVDNTQQQLSNNDGQYDERLDEYEIDVDDELLELKEEPSELEFEFESDEYHNQQQQLNHKHDRVTFDDAQGESNPNKEQQQHQHLLQNIREKQLVIKLERLQPSQIPLLAKLDEAPSFSSDIKNCNSKLFGKRHPRRRTQYKYKPSKKSNHYHRTHTCRICNQSFSWASSLRRHRIRAHRSKSKPSASTTNNADNDEVSPPLDIKCQYCNHRYASLYTYYEHLLHKHASDVLVAESLETEQEFHHGVPNICRLCNTRFPTRLSQLQHKLTAHPKHCGKSKKYKCDDVTCLKSGVSFWYSAQLQVHKAEVHKDDDDKVIIDEFTSRTCGNCGKIFPYPSQLKVHQNNGKCSNAPKNTKKKARQTILDISAISNIGTTCEACNNQEFESRLSYTDHVNRVHKDDPSFKARNHHLFYCEVQSCGGKIFVQRDSYRKHCKNVHNIEIPTQTNKRNLPADLKCTICSKQYKSKEGLVEHLLLHQGITRRKNRPVSQKYLNEVSSGIINKVHTCHICGKTSIWKHNLNKHLRERHSININTDTGDPEEFEPDHSICEVCGKTFKSNGELRQHLRSNVHGDSVKVYQCTICSRQYAIEANYIKHMGLHSASKANNSSIVVPKPISPSSSMVPGSTSAATTSTLDASSLTCTECGKFFISKHNIKRHLLCVHNMDVSGQQMRPPSFDCNHCGRSFKVKSLLDQHLKTKQHGGPGLPPRRPRNNTKPKRTLLITE